MHGANCVFQTGAPVLGNVVDEGSSFDHFGLGASPFQRRSGGDAFFCGTRRRATLDALTYALTQDDGIVKVSGEPGSGKTTLCRELARRLPDSVHTICLRAAGLSCDELLRVMAAGLDLPASDRIAPTLRTLQRGLDDIRKRGGRAVVLVDDAQSMPIESLALLCMLCDDDEHQHRLHIALFGPAELDAHLALCRSQVACMRITYNFVLDRLSRDEIGAYLAHCLDGAGYDGPSLFSPAALELIFRSGDRQFERINRVAERALQCAACGQADRIERKAVESALHALSLAPVPCRPLGRHVRLFSGLAAAFSLCLVVAVGLRSAPSLALPPPSLVVAPSSFASVVAEKTAETATIIAADKAAEAADGDASEQSMRRLEASIARTATWLQEASASHFVIQMLRVGADETARVERFLADLRAPVDPAQLRVYRSRLSGQPRLGVIYGDFPDRPAAQAALASLLAAMPGSGFYVRPVSRLR